MSLDFIKYRKDILVPIALLAISIGILSYNSLNGKGGAINPFSRVVLTLISYPQRLVSGVVHGIGCEPTLFEGSFHVLFREFCLMDQI